MHVNLTRKPCICARIRSTSNSSGERSRQDFGADSNTQVFKHCLFAVLFAVLFLLRRAKISAHNGGKVCSV